MYVEAFGGTAVDAYCALIDMGEIKESDGVLARCERIDAKAAKA